MTPIVVSIVAAQLARFDWGGGARGGPGLVGLAELHHLGLALAPHVAPVMRDHVMNRDIVTL